MILHQYLYLSWRVNVNPLRRRHSRRGDFRRRARIVFSQRSRGRSLFNKQKHVVNFRHDLTDKELCGELLTALENRVLIG